MATFTATIQQRGPDPEQIIQAKIEALLQGLYLLEEAAVTLAKDACPVDTGFLRSTHYAALPYFDGRYIVGVIGAWASYAPAVHETHPTARRWLARAAYEVASTGQQRLTEWLAAG